MAALALLLCTALVVTAGTARAACPHQEPGLKHWSSPDTWEDGSVPTGGDLTIDTRILLDVSTARMKKITITSGGKLVFDPSADSVKLSANMVELTGGEFWIGSEDCPFTGDAEVFLTGKRNESVTGEQKAILVTEGKLEVHGKTKRPWTQLSGTLSKTTREELIGTPIYSVSDNDETFSRSGFRMYEFKPSGYPAKNWGRLLGTKKLKKVMSHKGSIVVIVVSQYARFGKHAVEKTAAAFESLCYDGTKRSAIRNMIEGKRVSFAAVCHIGSPSHSVEIVGRTVHGRSQTGWLKQTIGGVDFAAMSIVSLSGPISANQVEIATYPTGALPTLERIVTVDDSVASWEIGDLIVVASTDFEMHQAQQFEVLKCPTCAKNQFKIMGPVLFTHWGEVTQGISMKAEVGLLSRNVRFHGEMEDECYGENLCKVYDYDTFGGHIKLLQNFTSARIENAELFHMGQQPILGSYPIHFHMCFDTSSKNAYVRRNSIHHTFSRCVTIHGTHNVTVENNVAYDHLGHCYFFEDGGEQDNILRDNLGLVTKAGSLLPSDVPRRVSTFWITNPDNELINNHAAGSDGIGIWILMPLMPTGLSANFDMGLTERQAQRTLLKAFKGNVVHSNGDVGFRLDDELMPDGTFDSDLYYPRVDPTDPDSDYALLEIDDFTAYKNTEGVWIKSMLTHITNFKLADNGLGILIASSISDDTGPHHEILANSLIIGETANIGEPAGNVTLESGEVILMNRSVQRKSIQKAHLGIATYRGPLHIINVTFSGFRSSPLRPAGAIGKKFSNPYFGSPINSVRNVKFDFAHPSDGSRFYDGDETVIGYKDRDGNRHQVLMDFDGSLTSYPGSTIIRPIPLLINARCVRVPRWGPGTALCPDRFSRLKYSSGEAGNVPTFMTRNDLNPAEVETPLAEQQVSYSLNTKESYILHFNKTVPRVFRLTSYGLQKNLSQVAGVCIGVKQMSLKVKPYKYSEASSMADLLTDESNSKYYYDPDIGVVMFRFTSQFERGDFTYSHCPGNLDPSLNGVCGMDVKIQMEAENHDGDCRSRAYPAYSTAPVSPAGALTVPAF